ncbi:MAG: dihydrofolate reductase family protein, partial [Actinomycetota bacterium]
MSKVTVDISISLDGFVAGPNPTLEEPLGEGGERLHEWVVATRPWRESHGLSGGETGIDADVVAESLG